MINHKPKCIQLSDHTFYHWLMKKEKEEKGYLQNLADNGAIGGVAGMTTYYETNELYDKYEQEIWQTLEKWSSVTDYTILEVLNNASKNLDISIFDEMSFKNLCVWWYAEVIAGAEMGYHSLLEGN